MTLHTILAAGREWAPNLADLFVFGGLGCVCYGAWLVYPPAAWIIGGAALFALGWLGTRF